MASLILVSIVATKKEKEKGFNVGPSKRVTAAHLLV